METDQPLAKVRLRVAAKRKSTDEEGSIREFLPRSSSGLLRNLVRYSTRFIGRRRPRVPRSSVRLGTRVRNSSLGRTGFIAGRSAYSFHRFEPARPPAPDRLFFRGIVTGDAGSCHRLHGWRPMPCPSASVALDHLAPGSSLRRDDEIFRPGAGRHDAGSLMKSMKARSGAGTRRLPG